MRVALDLLQEFANTEVFCLFHNCMWQSRHSWSLCPFPRAARTKRVAPFKLDLRLHFRLRLCLYLHVQQTLAHNFKQVALFFHWCSRSQVRNVCRFPEHSNWTFVLSKQVALFQQLDLSSLVGFVGSFPHVQQLLTPILSSHCLWRKSSEAVGWRKNFLVYDFSIFHHNSFRDTISSECVVKDDCVRSCLIELKSFPLSKFYVGPIHRVLMFLPHLLPYTKQDAVLPGQFSSDLCVLCSLDPQTWRIPSVFCSNFVLLVSILNSGWNVNWLRIRCDKCTRRKCSEWIHCPVMKDQWDCVLNNLEELGDKEFLVLVDHYNIEIFSCCLRLLPLCSCTFHQTNVGFCHSGSEDNLSISRIQSLHHLLEVDYHDEEECSIVSKLDNRWTNNLVVQYRSKFFLQWVQFLWMSWQKYVLCGLH